MPDCFLTAAERSGSQTPPGPTSPLWLRLRRAMCLCGEIPLRALSGEASKKISPQRRRAHKVGKRNERQNSESQTPTAPKPERNGERQTANLKTRATDFPD
jgi:hypothetical protein